jgi:hypothetical protein
MARSDNPDWDISPKSNFRIPQPMKDAAEMKIRLLKGDGYLIDDTRTDGAKPLPIDLTKYVRYCLTQIIDESTDETVQRLGLTRKDGQ